MKRVLMYMLAMAFLIGSCTNDASKHTESDGEANIYNDATLCKIYELRCSSNAAELVNYFDDNYPVEYRKAALMALGTMRDSMAVVSVASQLSNPDPEIREAAIFSLGQIGHRAGERYLMDIDMESQPDNVKSAVMVALSKCGGPHALEMVEHFKAPHSNVVLVSGQAKALCWFACRGMYSVNGSQTAIGFVCDTTIHEKARAIAAEYFGICNTDFSLYTDEFVRAYRSASLVYNRENIVLALGKCHNERAFNLLRDILSDNTMDYRVVLNAIVAFENYPYYDCKDIILNLLKSDDDKVSTCAARFICRRGIAADSSLYLDLSRNVPGWQTRTSLLSAALKYSKNKAPISNGIKSGFDVTQNIYEKVALLKALEPDFSCFRFVEHAMQGSDNEMIRTEALKTLVNMYENPAFPAYQTSHLAASGENLRYEFSIIFKKAVQYGNSQMVAIAAAAIARHTEIAEYYMNTFFLNQALSNCQLPREADTYMILASSIETVNGQHIDIPETPMSITPDWQYIRTIRPGQEIVIATKRGDITLRTDINNAPLAVSNFLRLVDDKYFDGSCFTNTNILKVENYGSFSGFDETRTFMIPSELSGVEFDEGTVALVTSALNHSCTTQWFVMLTPAALLDGTSSVVATVVDGMDVVHSLNTGDQIISITRR